MFNQILNLMLYPIRLLPPIPAPVMPMIILSMVVSLGRDYDRVVLTQRILGILAMAVSAVACAIFICKHIRGNE